MNSQEPNAQTEPIELIEPTEESKALTVDTSDRSTGCGLFLIMIGLPWCFLIILALFMDNSPTFWQLIQGFLVAAPLPGLGLFLFVRGTRQQRQWRNFHPIDTVSPSGHFDEGLILGLGIAGLAFIFLPFFSILSLPCGFVAALQGQRALKTFDAEGVQDCSLRTKVNAGRLCGSATMAFFLLRTRWLYFLNS